jgi:hypothetical protein
MIRQSVSRFAARRTSSPYAKGFGTADDRYRISGDGLVHRGTIDVLMRYRLIVRASGTAGLGASSQRVLDDGLDGARAAAAFSATAETAVDLLGVAGEVLCRLDDTADIVVAKDVTGTDNHKSSGPISDAEPFDIEELVPMQKEKQTFEVIPK